MELLEPPRVVELPLRHSLGIRVITPFRGMLGERDRLLTELAGWLDEHDVGEVGPFFLRLHVIDMEGPMDLAVGVIMPDPIEGDDRVLPDGLPAGRYATLTYRDHALRANRALIEWSREQGLPFDREDVAEGDRFGCRYEAYRTDPRTERRKTRWEVELAIRLAD
ncbi:GyrI-like domain-containing protein [Microlunatus parietis]|uniref:Effector-binding domain-containing protein n=1 Tax=Microlunatus parietis TaxID=682979 RepID=A0A7Y9I9B4_9ACTN|nr:GyrI-like domain-containing protein [Microlunatus parietis]NYE72716.1 hypothetical protein [Microlunatus parietis]